MAALRGLISKDRYYCHSGAGRVRCSRIRCRIPDQEVSLTMAVAAGAEFTSAIAAGVILPIFQPGSTVRVV